MDSRYVEELKKVAELTLGRGFWNVVSALRGPDRDGEGVEAIKRATTAVIRAKIGMTNWNLNINKDSSAAVEIRQKLMADYTYREKVGGHFFLHAAEAFASLGLKWDELNVF